MLEWHKGPKSDYKNVKSSGYYYQYAKIIISRHGSKDLNPVIGHELEIVPIDFRHYHAGEEIGLQVMYDGAALRWSKLEKYSKKRFHQLSGGMQRRLIVA